MTRDQMIEDFLDVWVPADKEHARLALTLMAETLERRATLRASLCGDLVPRREFETQRGL
jgi:hypothetical protein